jgi:DNA-binding response OmpR family regulator
MLTPSGALSRTIGSGAGAPILVVEDDPPLRQIIRDVLEDEGLVIETAADGRQALQRAATQRPVLVVLDMMLPVLDGVDVVAGLRATFGVPPPVLLITADGRAAEKARQVGAFAFLSKPLELDELVATVQRALESR